MDDIREGIPYVPSDPGFYREDGPVDWLRTQEGVWLHSVFPFNARWTLDASLMGPRPFMRKLTPIDFGDLDQYGAAPEDAGFWFDDRGPILWLRTIEGIWLVADLEAPYWWTLDVDNMPAVDIRHLHAVTLAEAQVLPDTVRRASRTRWTRTTASRPRSGSRRGVPPVAGWARPAGTGASRGVGRQHALVFAA